MMGTATCRGERAPVEAARQAISSPLLEEGGVKGARGVLINITASSRLSLHDVNEACSLIRGATTNEDVQINFGVVLDESMEDEVKITVIATGFQRENLPAITQSVRAAAAGAGETAVETVRPVEPEFSTFPFVAEPEPEPVVEAVADAEPEPESAPQVQAEEPALSMNDLDVPAYLRRNRRVHQ
jgi:cell division protein FtsZ